MNVHEALTFIFFSAIEWLALIVMTFAIFKFQLPGYWGRLLLSSFMLSLLSYMVLVELDMSLYGMFIQVPFVFFHFWQVFRIPMFYAALMVINGYVWYTLIQAVVLFIFQLAGNQIMPNIQPAFVIQSITAVMVFLIAWLLIRTNWGFTFVPDTDRVKISWNKLNIRLLIMCIIGYGVLSMSIFMFFNGYTALLIIILSAIVFGFLQYLVFKREYHDYG